MNLIVSLISTTLIITPIVVILLMLTPVLDKWFAARGRCWLWVTVMAGLCIPFLTFLPRPVLQIDVPAPAAFENAAQFSDIPWITEIPESAPVPEGAYDAPASPGGFRMPYISVPLVILSVWLLGLAIFVIYHVRVHFKFRRFVRKWGLPSDDPGVIGTLYRERSDMGIRADVRVRLCKGIHSPMLTGFISPVILLPHSYGGHSDLPLIFRHELTHYKRRDLWYKLALVAMRGVYWFNPVIHIMAAQANKDIETACDSQTVSGMDMTLRRRYSEIILSMAAGPRACRGPLTTNFTGGKNMLKQRFSNILGAAKKSGAALFIVTCALVFAVGLLVGFDFAAKPDQVPETAENPMISDGLPVLSDAIRAPKNETPEPAEPKEKAQAGLLGLIDGVNGSVSDAMAEMEKVINSSYADMSYNWSGTLNASNEKVYDSIDELKHLVFDQAKLTERYFDDVTSLDIATIYDNIKITRGGDKVFIRYYEWMEDQYTLNVSDGKLKLNYNAPPWLRSKNGWKSNGWLEEYLKSQDKQINQTVELVIPASVRLNAVSAVTVSGKVDLAAGEVNGVVEITTVSGGVGINGGKFVGGVTVNAVSGGVTADSAVFSGRATINNVSGKITVKDSTFTQAALNNVSGSTTATGSTFSDKAALSSVSGKTSVEDCTFSSISLNTVNGGGSVKLSGSAKNYNITFNTQSGNLTYNDQKADKKALQNKDADSRISFSSISGSFSVTDR